MNSGQPRQERLGNGKVDRLISIIGRYIWPKPAHQWEIPATGCISAYIPAQERILHMPMRVDKAGQQHFVRTVDCCDASRINGSADSCDQSITDMDVAAWQIGLSGLHAEHMRIFYYEFLNLG